MSSTSSNAAAGATTYTARWVLPITSPPIRDGAVTVADGRIVYVGRRAEAPGTSRDLGDAVLLPGLVNTHCHLELTAMRGFLEDLEFRRWILRLTSAKRAVMTRDMLADSARWGLVEGITAGITTYGDTCDSGVVFDAMIEAGVRGIMFQEVFGPDPAVADEAMRDLAAKVADLRPRQTARVRLGISPHAPYTVSDRLFERAAAFAATEQLPVAIHVAESEEEQRLVTAGEGAFAGGLRARGIDVAARGRSPVALLHASGILDRGPLLIHTVRVDDADIALMTAGGCTVAHCPVSNAKLGHGIAPLLELLAAGLPVGLGSDSVASNNRMDLLEEGRVAILMQRARTGSHEALTAADALDLATIGGARALGLESEIGSLEVGKAADLAAFDLGPAAPVQDPASAAIFALGGRPAILVTVDGVPLVEDGEPRRADPGLRDRVQAVGDALREWVAEGGELRPPPPLDSR